MINQIRRLTFNINKSVFDLEKNIDKNLLELYVHGYLFDENGKVVSGHSLMGKKISLTKDNK